METLQKLFVEPDAVIANLRAATGEEAIQRLYEAVSTRPSVKDGEVLLSDLRLRYQLSTECPAKDLAVPHARTAGVDSVVLAVGRAATPIAFDPEHPAVQMVFLVATPRPQVTEYLAIVSLISRVWRHAASRAALLAAADEKALRAALAAGVEAVME